MPWGNLLTGIEFAARTIVAVAVLKWMLYFQSWPHHGGRHPRPQFHPGAALVAAAAQRSGNIASGRMFSDQKTDDHAHIQSSYKCVIKGPLFVFLPDGERGVRRAHGTAPTACIRQAAAVRAAAASHSWPLLDGRAAGEDVQAACGDARAPAARRRPPVVLGRPARRQAGSVRVRAAAA